MNDAVIIVMEDDPSTLSLLCAVIRRSGAIAVPCSDGERGIAALSRSTPDAILLDLRMPRVDGFAVLRHLQGTAPDLCERTIILTALADSVLARSTEVFSARCVMRKPLDINALLFELAQCLATKREQSTH